MSTKFTCEYCDVAEITVTERALKYILSRGGVASVMRVMLVSPGG